MATPRDDYGQARIDISQTYIEMFLKQQLGLHEDARLLSIEQNTDKLTLTAVFETPTVEEQSEGGFVHTVDVDQLSVPEGGDDE